MELKFVTPISLCVFIMEEGGVDDPIFFYYKSENGPSDITLEWVHIDIGKNPYI